MNRRWIRSLALGLLALAWVGCNTLPGTAPASGVDRIRQSGEIRIGMTGDYPPLNVISRSGENIGLEPDLAGALAQALGVELKIVNKPFAELIPALEKGEVDAVMSGMTMTPERNMRVAFVGPYLISGKAVLTRTSTLSRVDTLGALDTTQVKLAVLDGSTSQKFAATALPEAQLLAVPDYGAAVQLVIDGQVDGLFADHLICLLAVLRNPDAGLATVVSPMSFEPIGMALPADDPLLANLMTNYLKVLEGTGLLEQLRARWMEDPSWLAELP